MERQQTSWQEVSGISSILKLTELVWIVSVMATGMGLHRCILLSWGLTNRQQRHTCRFQQGAFKVNLQGSLACGCWRCQEFLGRSIASQLLIWGEMPPPSVQKAVLELILGRSHVEVYVISPLSVCISCFPLVFLSVFLFCPVFLLLFGIAK